MFDAPQATRCHGNRAHERLAPALTDLVLTSVGRHVFGHVPPRPSPGSWSGPCRGRLEAQPLRRATIHPAAALLGQRRTLGELLGACQGLARSLQQLAQDSLWDYTNRRSPPAPESNDSGVPLRDAPRDLEGSMSSPAPSPLSRAPCLQPALSLRLGGPLESPRAS